MWVYVYVHPRRSLRRVSLQAEFWTYKSTYDYLKTCFIYLYLKFSSMLFGPALLYYVHITNEAR